MAQSAAGHRYILLWKPYGVICQFTPADANAGRPTLAALVRIPGVYPVGRLDHDSEGLVLLTDDGWLQHRLTDPRYEHPKTYLTQVDGTPGEDALRQLRDGVQIWEDFRSRPARVRLLDQAPALPPRDPPIRYRAAIPTAWLEITITEGRNRQVRRMTAAVGHPTLRLVRTAIGELHAVGLEPGQWREATDEERTYLRPFTALDRQSRPRHQRLSRLQQKPRDRGAR